MTRCITYFFLYLEIQNSDPQTFAMMTQALTEEQKASVQEVINQAILKQQKIGGKLYDFLILLLYFIQ